MRKKKNGDEAESVESLRRRLDTIRRNAKCFHPKDRLRFQISIDRIEKRLAELEKKQEPPTGA